MIGVFTMNKKTTTEATTETPTATEVAVILAPEARKRQRNVPVLIVEKEVSVRAYTAKMERDGQPYEASFTGALNNGEVSVRTLVSSGNDAIDSLLNSHVRKHIITSALKAAMA